MLIADKQNELRKKYYNLRGELMTASMEYGDAFYRRDKQPLFWHHFEVASGRRQKAEDALDAFLADLNVPDQDRFKLLRTIMYTCQELAGSRVRDEGAYDNEAKTIERQAAKDALNAVVAARLKELK